VILAQRDIELYTALRKLERCACCADCSLGTVNRYQHGSEAWEIVAAKLRLNIADYMNWVNGG